MRHVFLGIGMAVMLSGCGDPLRDFARLNDVNVSAGTAAVAPTAAQARSNGGGLFGRLLNRAPEDPTNAAVQAALADADATPDQQIAPAGEAVAQVAPVAAAPQRQRGGLFGIFRRNTAPTSNAALTNVPDATPQDATVAPADSPRRGLTGLFRRGGDAQSVPRSGPDASDVAAGAVMPFGQIGRVCGISRSDLGTRIEQNASFSLYDTIPNSKAPRPFYITGFADNCARTFTGAVVVTGDVETHEFVRYRPSNERIPFSETDNAYEALKASVCRVGRGQPCGARTAQLNRNTQFITVYDFFGGTFSAVPTTWAQILVHDGRVMAMSIKDG